MMLSSRFHYFIKKPKLLLLIDGVGAFYTASMLLIVKTMFISYLGLSAKVLECLAIMACCMGLFSTAASMFVKNNFYKYLRSIAIVNLIYCIITIGALVLNHKKVMIWGVAYFTAEALVIFSLSLIEIKISQALSPGIKNRLSVNVREKKTNH